MKKIDRAANAYKKNGFIKNSEKPLPSPGKGYAKAAKFLLLVGPDQAAEVLKQFSPDDVEKIVKEISQVHKLGRKESEDILKEFGDPGAEKAEIRMPHPAESIMGGPEKAREMLTAALGREKGVEVFNKVLPFGGRTPFDFLNDLHPEQILTVLKNEPPYVLSIVLSFIEPELSSKIISGLLPGVERKLYFV